jgi:hypothetical protein
MACVRERVAALGDALAEMGLADVSCEKLPVDFDLRQSLVRTWQRMRAGELLGQWH